VAVSRVDFMHSIGKERNFMFSFFPQVDDSEYAEKDVINLNASQIYSQQGICVCPSRDSASEPFSLSVEVCLQMEQDSHRFFPAMTNSLL